MNELFGAFLFTVVLGLVYLSFLDWQSTPTMVCVNRYNQTVPCPVSMGGTPPLPENISGGVLWDSLLNHS